MNQDRWGVTIRGKHISHAVAARDWYCECGYKIVTKVIDGEWMSVCPNDIEHDPDKFVHSHAIPYVQLRNKIEKEEAVRVFDHLPKDLQEAITKRRET